MLREQLSSGFAALTLWNANVLAVYIRFNCCPDNDDVYAEAGNDLVRPGAGSDTTYLGAGDDIAYIETSDLTNDSVLDGEAELIPQFFPFKQR